MFRTQKYMRVSTTDDIENFSETVISPHTLELLSQLKKQWRLLESSNSYICQSTTDFILKHKPIFDNQKLILIKIENLSNKLTANGLIKMYKRGNIIFTDRLSETTYNDRWNIGAKKMNKLLDEILKINNHENFVIEVMNGGASANYTTRKKYTFYCAVIIVLLITLIGIVYIMNDIYEIIYKNMFMKNKRLYEP